MLKASFENIVQCVKICSKLAIKKQEPHHRRLSRVFVVKVEQISHIDFVFPLITLNK